MHAYLACFDISDDRKRAHAAKHLERHGERVQKSVFEISVRNAEELQQLQETLQEFVEHGDDLRFYFLCHACREKSQDIDGERIARYPAAVVI